MADFDQILVRVAKVDGTDFANCAIAFERTAFDGAIVLTEMMNDCFQRFRWPRCLTPEV